MTVAAKVMVLPPGATAKLLVSGAAAAKLLSPACEAVIEQVAAWAIGPMRFVVHLSGGRNWLHSKADGKVQIWSPETRCRWTLSTRVRDQTSLLLPLVR